MQVDLSSLTRLLTEKGYRLTGQRQLLFEIIILWQGRIEAGQLLRLARRRDPAVNRATVYRTLDLFRQLVCKEPADPPTLKQQFRLVCLECKKALSVWSPALDKLREEIGRDNGFEVLDFYFEAAGYCEVCRPSTRRKAIATAFHREPEGSIQ